MTETKEDRDNTLDLFIVIGNKQTFVVKKKITFAHDRSKRALRSQYNKSKQ